MENGLTTTEKSQGSGGDAMKVQSLESAYVGLLERRIAQLEAQLADQPGSKSANGTESKTDPNGDATGADSKRPRVRKVVSVWDYESDTRRDEEKFDVTPKTAEDESTIFRRIMDSKDDKKLIDEELTVGSPGLKALLKKTLLHVRPHQFDTKKVVFGAPFSPFVWSWDVLVEAAKPNEGDMDDVREAREDLHVVLGLLEGSDGLNSYFNNRASHQAGKTITYNHLWTIFPPGTKVVARSFIDKMQMFEVDSTFRVDLDNNKKFMVCLTAFDWDGVVFKPYTYVIEIGEFESSRSVLSLPCYPIDYYEANGDERGMKLREALKLRGKRFFELCTDSSFQYEYSGAALFRSSEMDNPAQSSRNRTRTRLTTLEKSYTIVDNYSFLRSQRNKDNGLMLLENRIGLLNASYGHCPCGQCRDQTSTRWMRHLDRTQSHMSDSEKNRPFADSEDRLMLCPPKLLGYSLQLKDWCQLDIDGLKRLTEAEVAAATGSSDHFDNELELDKGDKAMLKALVQNHSSKPGTFMLKDAVESKGRGLVILLHGPPGVGKTLTAETIALASGKPLMSVSTAEIGVEPEDAEQSLRAIFNDASRWQAVLLIDEADVFLENRRGMPDLRRMALVAVLLRVLEYYEGIIILTTNRIMSLDVAVESRIHLAIQYRDLNRDQMTRIFQNFFDKVPDNQISDRDKLMREVKAIVKHNKLNGRQIRNIVKSSLLLAQSEGGAKLNEGHLEQAMEATQKFLECLRESSSKKRELNEAPPV